MNDPTIDRMSRELGTARRWATTMAERVWQLEDAIRRHLLAINPDGSHTFSMDADVELWQLIEGDDDV